MGLKQAGRVMAARRQVVAPGGGSRWAAIAQEGKSFVDKSGKFKWVSEFVKCRKNYYQQRCSGVKED